MKVERDRKEVDLHPKSYHVWWVPCTYHEQDCLVLKAFSHRLISGTAVYESWTFVSVDHLYHEVTDRVLAFGEEST